MTIAKYTVGFLLSLVLTLVAYFLVVGGFKSDWLLIILGVLAIAQMVVQLIFFLHVGEETGPRMRLASFVFMAGTLLIIVIGSLWIIKNMNYNMLKMSPTDKNNYMLIQHDKGF